SRRVATPWSTRLAELDDVAVRVAHPELGLAEGEERHAARLERALHLGHALDLEGEVPRRRVDALERDRVRDQVELAVADRVPFPGEAQIRPRRRREAEQPLVELARAGEVAEADG